MNPDRMLAAIARRKHEERIREAARARSRAAMPKRRNTRKAPR